LPGCWSIYVKAARFIFNFDYMRSDSELIQSVLEGQKGDFAEIVRRYERIVRAVTIGILKDSHLAEDAAQDAFVKAYCKLATLRNRDSFGFWITRIARRCALDIARKKQNHTPLDAVADIPAASLDVNLSDEKHQLLTAVINLPKGEKEVIMLRYFGGHAVRDVAAIAGRSVGTVTKQLSRAYGRLRIMLGGSKL
jgi:RNA polymerase sigma-70 factor (ECF subfamily)